MVPVKRGVDDVDLESAKSIGAGEPDTNKRTEIMCVVCYRARMIIPPKYYVRKIWRFEVCGVASSILQDKYPYQPECLYVHSRISILAKCETG